MDSKETMGNMNPDKVMNTPQFGCLQGVKVICQGGALAGPHGAALLAENGAQVIHIESSKYKDVARSTAEGYLVALEQRNQYQLGLDYLSPEGRKVFMRMLKDTDILIEVNKGGTYEKNGLTDDVLWGTNPKLVIVHVSGFGQYGDPFYYKRASYDFIGQSYSGFVTQNTEEDGKTGFAKPAGCDYQTGIHIALASVMALYRVSKTGVGESVDLAQYETMLRSSHWQVVRGLTYGEYPAAFRGCDAKIAGNSNYECKDGKLICLFVAGGPMLKRCAQMMGFEDDPDFYDKPMVYWSDPYSEKYINYTIDFCKAHTRDEVEKLCEQYGVACAPVMTYADMLESEHYKMRDDIVTYYCQNKDKVLSAPAPNCKFKNNPNQVWRGACQHGYDNETILRTYGYTDDEIKELYDCGAVGRLGLDSLD